MPPDFLSNDIGIDIGKRRLAYGAPQQGICDYMDLGKPGMRRDAELRQMRLWIHDRLPPDAQLWIDQTFAGRGDVSMTQGLSQTIAAVMTAHDWIHEPIIVHSSTWKAQVIGNHQAAKDDIKDWLYANYPRLWQRCRTEDEVDAMVIGIYGWKRSRGEILPPDVRRPSRRKK